MKCNNLLDKKNKRIEARKNKKSGVKLEDINSQSLIIRKEQMKTIHKRKRGNPQQLIQDTTK